MIVGHNRELFKDLDFSHHFFKVALTTVDIRNVLNSNQLFSLTAFRSEYFAIGTFSDELLQFVFEFYRSPHLILYYFYCLVIHFYLFRYVYINICCLIAYILIIIKSNQKIRNNQKFLCLKGR